MDELDQTDTGVVDPNQLGHPRVAVLVPCYNEAATIAAVVRDFARSLPEATVFVYDNNSSDDTAALAREAGAVVRREVRQGKGHVMRRMFADIDADVYVMVDGDDTYDASDAPAMVAMVLEEQVDMVVGARQAIPDADGVYPRGHTAGNRAFSGAFRRLFASSFTDIFSGYRAMSRRFVKSLPLTAHGFEVETEISAHAVEIDALCAEIPTDYGSRPEDSHSKLNTYKDGFRILFAALRYYRQLKPLRFYGAIFAALSVLAVVLAIPVVIEFKETGLVPRFPTAILAASIQIVAFISLTAGLVLDGVSQTKREARKLAYLSVPARSA